MYYHAQYAQKRKVYAQYAKNIYSICHKYLFNIPMEYSQYFGDMYAVKQSVILGIPKDICQISP